ncbi:hypothetical protein ACFC51_19775 [Streptomyces sp. NPDC055962]|uniref:hypothetical protein n=1 Tax=Streptomyces sp. NPDC055962 TaxID=3345667 RepID=UPI0035DB56D9
MKINGVDQQQRGHVLLIAGDAATRRRTVQVLPSANLAALSLLPTSVLLGSSAPSDTTYLDGIHDQNALQVRLRAAAATPGPLLVYLSGRLTTDRRGRQLYLALSQTTAATTRYTALPWEWLGTELRNRPRGLTTVLFDLAADKGAWPLLQEYALTPAATAAEVFGVVAPPGFSGTPGVSEYTRQWIQQLRRTPERLTNSQVHAFTVAAAALPPGALVIPSSPGLTASADQPSMTELRRLLAENAARMSRNHPAEEDSGTPAPGQPQKSQSTQPPAPPAPPASSSPAKALAPEEAPVPPVPQQGREMVPAPRPERHLPTQPPLPVDPIHAQEPEQDPRPYIHALAQAGRHHEAAQLAQVWEHHILQTNGYNSLQATQWAEIRADLAKMAGNWLLATQLWAGAGRTRLAQQAPDAPELLAAAQSAHYCWTQITDSAKAQECGPELILLLSALPALDRRHLMMAQQRLHFLNRQ